MQPVPKEAISRKTDKRSDQPDFSVYPCERIIKVTLKFLHLTGIVFLKNRIKIVQYYLPNQREIIELIFCKYVYYDKKLLILSFF